ncbi:DUF2407 C-terminal domain-containing protein [Lasiosphaeria miniovina]|uniref:DUF2407 C-terminal domain-containing protein n=1 Tax=Lasiosphaeria miniovina TaxID=1954250 RepID=A0AA40A0T3_9PEZI|nr:DUF2407 C-terminal domain-containing protein [Lasiosphaeria miniovina]KAK0706959.1 DUF2407 C-terminal domain-containing protein [Lasiosphaeria miniovina]
MPAVEVNHLRLQFRAIQAQRFTPDTMPSPDALTRMEDEWIDNDAGGTTTNPAATSLLYANGVNNSNNPATNNNGGGGDDGDTAAAAPATTTDDAYGLSAVSDQLLKGMVVGFFFPLGAAMWLQREDGLWSRRWAVFVWLGVLLSVSVGIVRALSAGDA